MMLRAEDAQRKRKRKRKQQEEAETLADDAPRLLYQYEHYSMHQQFKRVKVDGIAASSEEQMSSSSAPQNGHPQCQPKKSQNNEQESSSMLLHLRPSTLHSVKALTASNTRSDNGPRLTDQPNVNQEYTSYNTMLRSLHVQGQQQRQLAMLREMRLAQQLEQQVESLYEPGNSVLGQLHRQRWRDRGLVVDTQEEVQTSGNHGTSSRHLDIYS